MTWTLKEVPNGKKREFDSRSEAEETKSELEDLGVELELIPPTENGDEPANERQPEPPQEPMTQEDDTTEEAEIVDVESEEPQLDQDPVDWMPDHFVDRIQGVPTVNRKGYCVIAAEYDVSVTAEPVVRASETDFEYAEFRAIAKTEDGKEYSGFGSAHVDRQDGDDPHLLNELAETRALKRAVAWATGVGMTAIEEMGGA